MRAPRSMLCAATISALLSGCDQGPATDARHEPMREPIREAGVPAAGSPSTADDPTRDEAPPVSPPDERATAEIERALAQIRASGHRFIDQASEPDDKPSEYTAEQFASMLRTKWEWLGYDIEELAPWLDEIATRNWKTNLPYLVVLDDEGTTGELRPWLDAQLESQP